MMCGSYRSLLIKMIPKCNWENVRKAVVKTKHSKWPTAKASARRWWAPQEPLAPVPSVSSGNVWNMRNCKNSFQGVPVFSELQNDVISDLKRHRSKPTVCITLTEKAAPVAETHTCHRVCHFRYTSSMTEVRFQDQRTFSQRKTRYWIHLLLVLPENAFLKMNHSSIRINE